MENNSRRNPKMQNTMHELPHGSNTHKTKSFNIKHIPVAIGLMGISLTAPVYVTWIMTVLLGIYFYIPRNSAQKVNEPKTETMRKKTIYIDNKLIEHNLFFKYDMQGRGPDKS